LAVHAAEDRVKILDHRDPGAKAGPDGAELEADDAAADHDEMAGNLLERQRAGGRDDHLLVEIDINAGDSGDVGAGCDDDVPGLDRLRLAVLSRHLDLARGDDPARSL